MYGSKYEVGHKLTELLQISIHFTAAGPDLNLEGSVW